MTRPKLLFLATEDWFIRSHFMPLVERADSEGFEVVVAARSSGARLGPARLLSMPFNRAEVGPEAFFKEVWSLRSLLEAERPDIVHAIALKPIAQLLFTPRGREARAYAVTGRGYLAANNAAHARALSSVLARRLRSAVLERASMLLVENDADRRWVEADKGLPDDRVVRMPGAGVDTESIQPMPEPKSGPIVVGVASRLVWSKGIDIVVHAIQRLRALGENIELRIAGAIDEDNPEHIRSEDVAQWADLTGVSFVGHVSDIRSFWADAHIACLASRGGEGLPRALLEAAACGRPIVTTDVPGCAEFVGKVAGCVVARDNPDALATALLKLARDVEFRRQMATGARRRVESGYTSRHASTAALIAWQSLLETS